VAARIGWFLMLVVVVGTDVFAATNNKDSLTSTFRKGVAETGWRWPVLILIVLLVAHLYMPPSLRKYDPIDRLYYRLNPAGAPPEESAPAPPGRPTPDGSAGPGARPSGGRPAS
jgi:hypothetical protein